MEVLGQMPNELAKNIFDSISSVDHQRQEVARAASEEAEHQIEALAAGRELREGRMADDEFAVDVYRTFYDHLWQFNLSEEVFKEHGFNRTIKYEPNQTRLHNPDFRTHFIYAVYLFSLATGRPQGGSFGDSFSGHYLSDSTHFNVRPESDIEEVNTRLIEARKRDSDRMAKRPSWGVGEGHP